MNKFLGLIFVKELPVTGFALLQMEKGHREQTVTVLDFGVYFLLFKLNIFYSENIYSYELHSICFCSLLIRISAF